MLLVALKENPHPESLTRNVSLAISPGEPAGEEAHVGEQHPGGGAGDGGLKVLGEAAAAAEPGEAAFDHPAPRQQLEAFDAGRALDNFDGPRTAIGNRLLQLRAAI